MIWGLRGGQGRVHVGVDYLFGDDYAGYVLADSGLRTFRLAYLLQDGPQTDRTCAAQDRLVGDGLQGREAEVQLAAVEFEQALRASTRILTRASRSRLQTKVITGSGRSPVDDSGSETDNR